VNDETYAVMAVDPGGTTGIAAGYVELKPSLKKTLATLSMAKTMELEGDWLTQARRLSHVMARFQMIANVENSLPAGNIQFTFEDFVLRRRQQGGATGNLTSIWVAAGAVAAAGGLTNHSPIFWEQASSAKTLATDARLKHWGLWEKGSPHIRDAWRHFVLRVNRLVP
jgi:hypothetical protein